MYETFIEPEIKGLKVIKPKVFSDERGYFTETWNQISFNSSLLPTRFVQDNQSMSIKGVRRGLHFQKPPYAQSKLVRCVVGSVLDVAVDIRKGSPTYGKHYSVLLSEDNMLQFFIPKGFAHGFSVLSEKAVFQYKCDNYYHPEAEGGISIEDETLGIDWMDSGVEPILSEKDKKHPLLKDLESPFIYDSSREDFVEP